MSARELLLVRRDDVFAVVDGALPEVSADVAVQDSIAPIREAGETLAGAPVTLTMRLLSPRQNLNVLHCDRAPNLSDWLALDRVAAAQPLTTSAPGLRGAIPGSWPIWGSYLENACPNWAAKFFIDGLMDLERIQEAGG